MSRYDLSRGEWIDAWERAPDLLALAKRLAEALEEMHRGVAFCPACGFSRMHADDCALAEARAAGLLDEEERDG